MTTMISVRMPDELVGKLKSKAITEGKSLTAVVTETLESVPDRRTRALDRGKSHRRRGLRLVAVISPGRR